ncbi:MAG: glycosyltransferase family 4 protein [Treponema sp.]|nr:glycosyltransferase family 4 protein [Treponema sp.]
MNKKRIIAINGECWCRNLTGIERLAIEVTSYLDELVKPGQMELILPSNAKNIPHLKNIKTVILPVQAHFIPKWTQIDYQGYVLKNHRYSFNYSNTAPFFCPGFEFIHDIYAKLYTADLKTKRDKLIQLYSNLMYRTIAKRARLIFTVSEYTKKTIIDRYKTPEKKIKVVYSGVSAYSHIKSDESIFERLPSLREKSFYFTLGSLSTRKNLKWIARHAELYPNELFAVSGKALPSLVAPELEKMKTLKNVIMTGYLSDEEVKALLHKCKAFIFPSYFEGFGLPPLEALSCGCPIIISNATCLPEIYGNCAHYIDPENADVNLDALLAEKVEEPDRLFEKYNLKKTAGRIYEILQSEDYFI